MPERRERLLREATLRRSEQFRRCYREGRRRHGSWMTLHVAANGAAPRLGVTASRKVGGAVDRNRLKRQIREAFRRHPARDGFPAADLLFHLKPGAGRAPRAEVAREIARLLDEAARRSERR